MFDGKKLLTVLEPDKKHGGLTHEQIHTQLTEATRQLERWGLAAEMLEWGFPSPSGDEMYATLMGAEPLLWQRISPFQACPHDLNTAPRQP